VAEGGKMTSITEDEFGKRSQIRNELKEFAPNLHQATINILIDMYSSDRLQGTESDKPVPIDMTRISLKQGAMINKLMHTHSTERSLEIGFAFGFSTIWMLDALRSQSNSLHIAIDPFEKIWWGGVGLYQVQRLGSETRFNWNNDLSIHALSDLIRETAKFDFIYIDGNHRFDDVIVDFYLSDQILKPGGLIVFDDIWMPSIQTAVSFVLNNRDYEPVPQSVDTMTVIKKKRNDDRDWSHFINFAVGQPLHKRIVAAIAKRIPSASHSRQRNRSGS
jgi:predicted O-methyltransferase YrrM